MAVRTISDIPYSQSKSRCDEPFCLFLRPLRRQLLGRPLRSICGESRARVNPIPADSVHRRPPENLDGYDPNKFKKKRTKQQNRAPRERYHCQLQTKHTHTHTHLAAKAKGTCSCVYTEAGGMKVAFRVTYVAHRREQGGPKDVCLSSIAARVDNYQVILNYLGSGTYVFQSPPQRGLRKAWTG